MLWTLLRRHGRRYRGAVAAVVVLQLISTLAMLYLPSLNARIIDEGVALSLIHISEPTRPS